MYSLMVVLFFKGVEMTSQVLFVYNSDLRTD